jgi:hypothetical protein
MGCAGSKDGAKGPQGKKGPAGVGSLNKPILSTSKEQYLDKWMDPAKYGSDTVKLSEQNFVALGTQDDDFAVVDRPIDLKLGSTFNFEVVKTTSKDFGVGLVTMREKTDEMGRPVWVPIKMWQFFF